MDAILMQQFAPKSSHKCMVFYEELIAVLVLQRKPFAFELFFCLVNAGFFTFSSKTRSIVPTSNLCRNVQRPKNQLNHYYYLERTDTNTSIYTTNQR